ncbi:MAG: cupin domain-containing protein [Chloroflexota bacterium]
MPRKAHSPLRRGLRWHYRQMQEGASGGSTVSTAELDVGSCLRRLREERNLTIRTLAEISGLAINTLSLIENGKSSPSVSTLQQLALALDVPVTLFFETEAAQQKVAYVKADCRPRASFEHGFIEDLGPGACIRAVEPFMVTLEPNAGSGLSEIVHTGYEFVYCLEGRIAYWIDNCTYLLEAGDSLLFEAHLPHRWQNLNATRSRSILILYPTDERDYPTERHFIQTHNR